MESASYFGYFKSKLADGVIGVMDEIKFWSEVFTEYMEWDESSAQRIADQYRNELRAEIRESSDI